MNYKTFMMGVTGFIVGGVVGALITLFNAPQSGLKTRAMLRDKSIELKDKAVGSLNETRSQATHFVDNLVEDVEARATRLMRVGREAIDKEKHLLTQSAKKAQKAIQA